MIDFQKRAWVSVDLSAVEENMKTIRQQVSPETMIMGVVKADAYGHGDRCIAKTLEQQGLVSWFGVSRLEEGLALRDYGITLPILVFGITPPAYAKTLVEYQLTPTVHTLDYANQLDEAMKKIKAKHPVHIKIDTGMSRMGFLVYGEAREKSLDEIEALCQFEHLEPQGLYTHFAVSDTLTERAKDYTREQYTYYIEAKEALAQRGVSFPIYHCSNSAAIINYPEMNLDMVRAGIILYGLHPAPDSEPYLTLTPVMEFHAQVESVKEIPATRSVSYGRTFTAQRPTKLANVGVGYADGYDRIFSNKGQMLLRGHRVVVAGRVCMDQLMLDVTDLPEVCVGDQVTIVGRQGAEKISFEDLADATGTIHYEKTSVIGKRVPRVYYKEGNIVDVTDLLRGRSHGFEKRDLRGGMP